MPFKCTISIQLIFLLYFIYRIGALTPFNVNFNIDFTRSCDRSSSFFTRKLGISLTECVTECEIRPKCKAINFYRTRQVCELFDIEQYSNERMASCVYIRKADILNARPCDCSQNEVCVTEGTGYTCKVKECEYLQVQNGVVRGNTNYIGSVQQYSCHHRYVPVGRTENIQCMESGLWNVEPMCLYGSQIGEFCSASQPICVNTKAQCINSICVCDPMYTYDEDSKDCVQRSQIGGKCSASRYCLNTKAQCINSICFCDPMYTYDEDSKDCVQRCTVLHDSFVKHQGIYFSGYNDKIKYIDTQEGCEKECIADPSCFHFEVWYRNGRKCTFGRVTYEMMIQADPASIKYTNSKAVIYSRTCS